jgi:hypothetical protein
MSGNTNMRPAGYRSRFGTTAKTAWEYWNIYCFAIAIGFHSLAKDALDAHFRVIEQELEGWETRLANDERRICPDPFHLK